MQNTLAARSAPPRTDRPQAVAYKAANMASFSYAAALLLALLAAAHPAAAGCYRNGARRPTRAAAELSLNHVPAKRLGVESMPADFTWCAPAGARGPGAALRSRSGPRRQISGAASLRHQPQLPLPQLAEPPATLPRHNPTPPKPIPQGQPQGHQLPDALLEPAHPPVLVSSW